MKKITRIAFCQFLRENGVLPITFIRRWYQGRRGFGFEHFSKYFETAHHNLLVSGSFNWENTPEGLKYWARLDTKFIKWYKGQKDAKVT